MCSIRYLAISLKRVNRFYPNYIFEVLASLFEKGSNRQTDTLTSGDEFAKVTLECVSLFLLGAFGLFLSENMFQLALSHKNTSTRCFSDGKFWSGFFTTSLKSNTLRGKRFYPLILRERKAFQWFCVVNVCCERLIMIEINTAPWESIHSIVIGNFKSYNNCG